ncbi:hypothetical protein ACROYT_G020108 [Oculina patagonica]
MSTSRCLYESSANFKRTNPLLEDTASLAWALSKDVAFRNKAMKLTLCLAGNLWIQLPSSRMWQGNEKLNVTITKEEDRGCPPDRHEIKVCYEWLHRVVYD